MALYVGCRVLPIYQVYLLKNAKHLPIPLLNVEISRFIPFWKGIDTGILLRKVKTDGNYQTVYERRLKRHCFGHPVSHLKNPT